MFKQEHYNAVLQAIVDQFNIDPKCVPQVQWIAWRAAIKRLFLQDILIQEIIDAIPQASKKLEWPTNTSFFHRVEDIVYLNRRKKEQVVKVDTGLTKITFNSPIPSNKSR